MGCRLLRNSLYYNYHLRELPVLDEFEELLLLLLPEEERADELLLLRLSEPELTLLLREDELLDEFVFSPLEPEEELVDGLVLLGLVVVPVDEEEEPDVGLFPEPLEELPLLDGRELLGRAVCLSSFREEDGRVSGLAETVPKSERRLFW